MSYRAGAKHQCPACGMIKMELIKEADPPWLMRSPMAVLIAWLARSPKVVLTAISLVLFTLTFFVGIWQVFWQIGVDAEMARGEIARIERQIHELQDESGIQREQVVDLMLQDGYLENEQTRFRRDLYLISHPTVWREMEGTPIYVNPWWSCIASAGMHYTCVTRETGNVQVATRGEVRELMRGIEHDLVGRRTRRQPDPAFWERRAR